MENLNSNNYYDILGIPKNADEKTIKNTYKKLARKYHPDKNINTKDKEEREESFKIINEAYKILSDSEKRNKYDKFGKMGIDDNIDLGPVGEQLFNFFSEFTGFVNNKKSTNYITKKEHLLKKNSIVKVLRLISNPDFNNKIGRIVDYKESVDSNNGNIRYIVELLETKKKVALKESNIQQIIQIKLINSVNIIELESDYGDIIDFDENIQKYKVVINDNVFFFKPDNILIPNGTSVKIKSHNKIRGTIVSFNKFNKNYDVKISEKDILNLNCNDIIV